MLSESELRNNEVPIYTSTASIKHCNSLTFILKYKPLQ